MDVAEEPIPKTAPWRSPSMDAIRFLIAAYPTNSSSGTSGPMWKAWKEGKFTDMLLIIKDDTGKTYKEIPCHRLHLSLRSRLVATQLEFLERTKAPLGPSGMVEIKITYESPEVIETILSWMYSDVLVMDEDIVEILYAADFLQVDELFPSDDKPLWHEALPMVPFMIGRKDNLACKYSAKTLKDMELLRGDLKDAVLTPWHAIGPVTTYPRTNNVVIAATEVGSGVGVDDMVRTYFYGKIFRYAILDDYMLIRLLSSELVPIKHISVLWDNTYSHSRPEIYQILGDDSILGNIPEESMIALTRSRLVYIEAKNNIYPQQAVHIVNRYLIITDVKNNGNSIMRESLPTWNMMVAFWFYGDTDSIMDPVTEDDDYTKYGYTLMGHEGPLSWAKFHRISWKNPTRFYNPLRDANGRLPQKEYLPKDV